MDLINRGLGCVAKEFVKTEEYKNPGAALVVFAGPSVRSQP